MRDDVELMSDDARWGVRGGEGMHSVEGADTAKSSWRVCFTGGAGARESV